MVSLLAVVNTLLVDMVITLHYEIIKINYKSAGSSEDMLVVLVHGLLSVQLLWESS